MRIVKLSIISDLHCKYDRDNSNSTYLYSDLPRIPISKHPIQSLKYIIKKESLTSDYVICPGDISDKMDIQGLISGYGFLNEIKNDLKAQKLLCVPGNHDVDSRKIYPEEAPFEILKKYILDFPLEESNLAEKFWANNYVVFRTENIHILIINSVFNHFDTENAQKSTIPQRMLQEIEDEIKADINDEIIKIAVCHHHPIKISNIDSIKYNDGDSLENGDKLLKVLSQNKYHIFIHGHKHIPQLFLNNDFPVFCSGSFSSLENIIESPYKNCFHIIELYLENQICKGKINTWLYTCGKGWAKSKDPDESFPAYTGFGLNANMIEMASNINDWFMQQGKDRIHYDKVLIAFDDIQFLTPFQQYDLSNELLKFGLEFNPTLSVGAKELSKQLI